jgi:hypothetical protein
MTSPLPPIRSPIPADLHGFIVAATMHGDRDFSGIRHARIWTCDTRADALQEGRYWKSRKFLTVVRPEKRGYTLYAALSDELLDSLTKEEIEQEVERAKQAMQEGKS